LFPSDTWRCVPKHQIGKPLRGPIRKERACKAKPRPQALILPPAGYPASRHCCLFVCGLCLNIMTIQQTIDIPASRKVHFDITLPEDAPYGRTEVDLDFKPAAAHEIPTEGSPLMDAKLAELVAEAERRAERERADPVYRQKVIDSFRKAQEGGPIFGGVDGLEYQRKCRNEWEDRI
jgi:hypothetical protein